MRAKKSADKTKYFWLPDHSAKNERIGLTKNEGIGWPMPINIISEVQYYLPPIQKKKGYRFDNADYY